MDIAFERAYEQVTFSHRLTESPDKAAYASHCHNHYELLYVAQGYGKYIVEGAEYPLCPHSVFLFRPTEYHYVRADEDTPYERYVIGFSESFLSGTSDEFPILHKTKALEKALYFPPEAVSEPLVKQFETLAYKPLFSDRPASDPLILPMIRSVIGQILVYLSLVKPSYTAISEDALTRDVLGYLNEHLGEDITLESTAKHFFVSKYYLSHTFRKHTGISLYTYLTTKRITTAKQLLSAGVPAAEAAFRVGFHDYSSFYRAYKKQTGKSPSRHTPLIISR